MILCGTDLSSASEPALQAAAALARKQRRDILLVHVRESPSSGDAASDDMQLEREAAEIRRAFGVTVDTEVLGGVPEEKLLQLAQQQSVELIVVGARGGARHSRRLGSVPEYLCQKAHVPVLVARDSSNLVSWSSGAKPLRVVVGSGLGDTSKSALEYVAAWPDLSLTVAHVAWPFGEHYRLGIAEPMPLDHLRPEVHHQIIGELGKWTSETHVQTPIKLDVSPGFGRIDCHLAQIAEAKAADLLVVGTHQRNSASRLWHGSVSRTAIHEANCSVLCVPQRLATPHTAAAPATVVIPTDFSTLADRAIAYGYSLVGRGGIVHLVHVVASLADANQAEIRGKLAARIPVDAEARGISSELHVLDGTAAWLAIWQHAGRSNADLICMATHSRDAVRSLLLGSQAQALLQHARIPVLLVPPDRES